MQQIILQLMILLTTALVVAGAPGAAVTALTTARNDVDVVVVPNFSHQGTESISTSTKYESPQCSSEGRFSDPDNCRKYYDCVPSHNGGFVVHQQSCFGYAFHPTLKACVPRPMVKGCVPSDRSNSIRSILAADTKVQQICNNAVNDFLCIDCKTLAICIEGKPHIQPCDHGSVCSMKMKKSFNGGVCCPGDPVKCTCNEADILRQDLYNPSKFLSCGNKGTDPTIHSCPGESIFNEQHGACSTEIESACTESGIFVIKDDCTSYYTCIFTTGGWFHKEFTCKNNTMFNEKTSKCEDPCDWYSDNFTCEEEGRFANPVDCIKYYVCIAKPLITDSFICVEQECPEGYEWSQVVINCVPSLTAREKCLRPVKPNECIIPNEWCTSAVCSPKCLNGNCTGPNTCNCDEGWTGNYCQNTVCSPKCLNGNCTGPNTCKCEEGWTGNHCQNIMCSPICLNGNCTGPNKCNCDEGWTGNHCQTPMCSPICLNGNCTGPNKCNCDEGWTGNHCQTLGECPVGFFTVNGAYQCFKFFDQISENWYDAKSRCISEGLRLAEPSYGIAIILRKYIYETYGNSMYPWLGAHGDGTYIRWQSNNEIIKTTNPLWYPDHPSVGPEKCLLMLVHEQTVDLTPFYTVDCSTNVARYSLCEKLWA